MIVNKDYYRLLKVERQVSKSIKAKSAKVPGRCAPEPLSAVKTAKFKEPK